MPIQQVAHGGTVLLSKANKIEFKYQFFKQSLHHHHPTSAGVESEGNIPVDFAKQIVRAQYESFRNSMGFSFTYISFAGG